MDLSSASAASDIQPSRILRMRAALAQLLQARPDGQTGLVVFAGTAHVVSPLTDDPANVRVFVDSLSPGIMPVDGQDAAAALRLARAMLDRSGAHGRVLLMTDHADAAAIKQAAALRSAGHTVDVMGVGATADTTLASMATAGGGTFVPVDRLPLMLKQLARSGDDAGSTGGTGGAQWQDGAAWVVPALLLLLLPVFRRGAVGVLALAIVLPLAMPLPAQAGDFWRRADQQAHARIEAGNRAYRAGDFGKAADAYAKAPGADGQYNLGNALAKAGRYPQAIAAYDRALEQQPGMVDAIANRKAVLAAMRQPPPSGGSKQGQQSRPQQGQSGQSQSQGQSDAATQQAANAAQRQRMREALAKSSGTDAKQPAPGTPQRPAESAEARERRQRDEAWLRRVPDDPGALLRRKFQLEYEQGKGR